MFNGENVMKAFPEVKYVAAQGGMSSLMVVEGGMDLRDYFAAKAMQGLLAEGPVSGISNLTRDAYRVADAMMKAREE
jgi:hypothetical protein